MQEKQARYMSKKLGGWDNMRVYERAFGSFAFPTPGETIFTNRDTPPTLDDFEKNYGNSVHFGLRSLFAASKRSGRGKGGAFKHLASQPPAALVDAAVFIAKDTFSQDAQLQPLGVGDRFGYWYPCMTMRFVDANCSAPFWCPRLALDGTKCWWAHGTRFVFVSPDSEIVDAQVPEDDGESTESGASKISESGKDKGVPEDNDDDDDDATTFASSESGDSSWCDVSSCSSDFSFEAQSMLPHLPPILEDTAMADGLAAQEAAEQEDTAGLAAQEADDSLWDILD